MIPDSVASPSTSRSLWRQVSPASQSLDRGYIAIAEAAQAFTTWRTTPAPERGALVARLGELLVEHKAELASLVTIEAGKIASEALGEVHEMIDICRFAVGLCLAGVYPIGMKLVVTWAPDQAGAALGWLVGALTLGTAAPFLVRGLDEAVSVNFRHSALRLGRYGDYMALYGEKGTLHVDGTFMQGPMYLKTDGPTWEELAIPISILDSLPDEVDHTQRNWNQLAREFVADIEASLGEDFLKAAPAAQPQAAQPVASPLAASAAASAAAPFAPRGIRLPGLRIASGSNERIRARTTSMPVPSSSPSRGAFDRPTPW